MTQKSIKKRNWACVVYPESLPDDWLEILQKSGLQVAVSPLHDLDINADGEPKKPHYHVILVYGSPTTYNNVKSLTDRLHAPAPQALEQVRGYYRYLTHKDNPEKAQYNDSDIATYNGFDILDYVELTKSEVNRIIKDIHIFINTEQIYEYCDLMDCILDRPEWYDVASSHTYYFDRYITSLRHKRKCDGDTQS